MSGDIFRYDCEEDYIFNNGRSSDYIYKCLDDGSYNNTNIPFCITSWYKFYIKDLVYTFVKQKKMYQIYRYIRFY